MTSGRLRGWQSTILAYAGALLMFALTSLYSPGFAAPSHLRSLIVVSAFTGIVALGQTLVVISGGIDLSVPWVLNSAAILVTLIARGADAPLLWAVSTALRTEEGTVALPLRFLPQPSSL